MSDPSDRSNDILFQTSREPLVMCSRDGTVVAVNGSSVRFFQLEDVCEIVGCGLFSALGVIGLSWDSALAGTARDSTVTVTWSDRTGSGERAYAEARFVELDESTIVVGFAPAEPTEEIQLALEEKSNTEISADLVIAALQFKQMYHENEHLANTDSLTGVHNRRSFDAKLAEFLADAVSTSSPLSVIVIDADRFKDLNDSQGHQVGDEALRGIAGLFQRSVRGMDVVGRIGGEEFGILLPGADRATAIEVAERVRSRVEGSEVCPVQVTVSLGVATMAESVLDSARLLSAADQALYHSKAMGRNQVTHADDMPHDVAQYG